MLLSFRVENFMSYKDEVELSMEVGERLTKFSKSHTFNTFCGKMKTSLLKSVILMGANGSGKSNLLSALYLLKRLVVRPTKAIDDLMPSSPFKLTNETRKQPTIFSIDFIIDGVKYTYSISYTKEKVINEKLVINNGSIENVYFDRDELGFRSDAEELTNSYSKIRKNKLVLYEGMEINDSVCKKVYTWFSKKLVIFSQNNDDQELLLKRVIEDPGKKKAFLEIMKFADFNIIDFEVRESVFEFPKGFIELFERLSENNIDRKLEKSVTNTDFYTIYKEYDAGGNVTGKASIHYRNESSGTQKLMMLGAMIIESVDSDSVIIMDEFDDAFHVDLSKAILRMINSEGNSNQFVLSSHTIDLMDCDLRTDQVYLVEKDFRGVSEVYSIFDFKDSGGKIFRADIKFAKRYLSGKFGAIPNINADGLISYLKESASLKENPNLKEDIIDG